MIAEEGMGIEDGSALSGLAQLGVLQDFQYVCLNKAFLHDRLLAGRTEHTSFITAEIEAVGFGAVDSFGL